MDTLRNFRPLPVEIIATGIYLIAKQPDQIMSPYGQSYHFEINAGMTDAVKYLIIANIGCFLLQLAFPEAVLAWGGLRPSALFQSYAVWQLVTYMFLHGNPWHLIFNMLGLWSFGCSIERAWGMKRFMYYYLLCGFGGGLCQSLINIHSGIPIVGASGAIYGLLLAFALVFWDEVIGLFLLPVFLKAQYLVALIVGISLLFDLYQRDVAVFAHLGGMAVGFVYLKIDWRWRLLGRNAGASPAYGSAGGGKARGLSALKNWFRRRKEKSRHMEVVRRRQRELHLRERVDAILDKINEVGYEKLSEEEKQILRRASQSLSQENLRSPDYGPN